MKKIDIATVRNAVASSILDQATAGLIAIIVISFINLFLKDEEDN